MSLEELQAIGKFLIGDTQAQPGWLQNIFHSVSPQGDFVCLAKTQNMVLLRSRWCGGKLELKPSIQQRLGVLEESEEVTSSLVLPVYAKGRLNSCWNCTVLGFSTGVVRFYTESGQLVIQRSFHPTAVKHLKIQSMPEGKHAANILFMQAALELLVVYENQVVCISGGDLLDTLCRNMEELASSMAHGLQTASLASLQASRLIIREQEVADCESFIYTNTSYRQYFQLTMQGGMMDSRHRAVSTLPYFLTVGQEPFLQYNEKGNTATSPTALAKNMVSTVKSGFFRVASGALSNIWSTRTEEERGETRPDPETKLDISHSLKDTGRQGLEVCISPNKMYSAVKDSQNRIILVCNLSRTVVQMWRGYHRCQMGWSVASEAKLSQEVDSSQNVGAVLIIYLPRRGLIEVWSPEQKNKVTEFHVSKHGTLIRSAFACLDDGFPKKRDSVRLYTAFLHPSGRISHFFIPFHALSTSSSAERDLQTQARILQLLAQPSSRPLGFLQSLTEELEAVKNIQLKNYLVSWLLTREQHAFSWQEADHLVAGLLGRCISQEKKMPLEQQLYWNKLLKLRQLVGFFRQLELVQLSNRQLMAEVDDDVMARLGSQLSVDVEQLAELLEMVRETEKREEYKLSPLPLCDFLMCFELEGELQTSDRIAVRLKKSIPPLVHTQLCRLFCLLCYQNPNAAQEAFTSAGLAPLELFQLVMAANLRDPEYSLENLSSLHQTLLLLLTARPSADDRLVSGIHDLARRVLLKQDMTPALFAFVLVLLAAEQDHRVHCPGTYAEEWRRRLRQLACFYTVHSCYRSLLAAAAHGDEQNAAKFSLGDVFDAGQGRMAELIAKWLIRLGSSCAQFAARLDSVMAVGTDDEQEVETVLVSVCAEFCPRSMEPDILLVHLAWEELQLWQGGRDALYTAVSALTGIKSISCPSLRLRLMHLIWRTFFAKLFREVARKTEEFKKMTVNESAVCERDFGMQRETVPDWIQLVLQLLDKMLELTRVADVGDDVVGEYDEVCSGPQLHLLHHVKATALPDGDALSFEHQVATVLSLTWQLKLPSRPLKLFSSVEIQNLLNTQPSVVVSWFSEYNANVKHERLKWIEVVCEAATGHIYRLPGENQFELEQYRILMDQLHQLGKVWFMSDNVSICQCEALFRAGHDSLGMGLRGTVADSARLSQRLLEVALLRLTKHLFHISDTGRYAAVPTDLVAELAARRGPAATLADAGLADTLALFLWTLEHLEAEDLRHLATQGVAAMQVLQVRRNRLQD